MPTVSVIVPNYNHAKFLKKRLQSILEQTYQDFEIIYLDDASTDNSHEVFSEFSNNPKVREIVNEVNSGSPFAQWNKGIKEARGEYIWIAESDDYAHPMFLETLVNILNDHHRVDLVYCQSNKINEYDQIVEDTHCWTDDLDKKRWHNEFINNGVEECRKYLYVKNTIPNASAVLARTQSFKKIGYADESMRLCGDWLTWIKILHQADVAFCPKRLNFWRTHPSTVRSDISKNIRSVYEKMRILSFFHENIGIDRRRTGYENEKLLRKWMSLILHTKGRISLKDNLQIYLCAKSYDPYTEIRILKQLGIFVVEKLGTELRKIATICDSL